MMILNCEQASKILTLGMNKRVSMMATSKAVLKKPISAQSVGALRATAAAQATRALVLKTQTKSVKARKSLRNRPAGRKDTDHEFVLMTLIS